MFREFLLRICNKYSRIPRCRLHFHVVLKLGSVAHTPDPNAKEFPKPMYL